MKPTFDFFPYLVQLPIAKTIFIFQTNVDVMVELRQYRLQLLDDGDESDDDVGASGKSGLHIRFFIDENGGWRFRHRNIIDAQEPWE